jgi:regulator of replication initiation timing
MALKKTLMKLKRERNRLLVKVQKIEMLRKKKEAATREERKLRVEVRQLKKRLPGIVPTLKREARKVKAGLASEKTKRTVRVTKRRLREFKKLIDKFAL